MTKNKTWIDSKLMHLVIDKEDHILFFQELNKSRDFYEIDQYIKLLPDPKNHKAAIAQLYLDLIPIFLEEKVGRKYYKIANRYLIKASKLGSKVESEKLRLNLVDKYKNRPSLLEELG